MKAEVKAAVAEVEAAEPESEPEHVEFIRCDGCGRSTHDDHACGCYECNVNFCPDCTHTHLVRDVDGLLCHECS